MHSPKRLSILHWSPKSRKQNYPLSSFKISAFSLMGPWLKKFKKKNTASHWNSTRIWGNETTIVAGGLLGSRPKNCKALEVLAVHKIWFFCRWKADSTKPVWNNFTWPINRFAAIAFGPLRVEVLPVPHQFFIPSQAASSNLLPSGTSTQKFSENLSLISHP